jgi:Flp pilus assembly protein TadD
MLEASARVYDSRARSLFQEARSRMHAEKESEALALLRQALLHDPENPEALSLYGVCLAKVLGDYEQGIRVCKLALHMAPGDVELRTNLGRVYRLRGNNDVAYRLFLDAWRRDRHHASPAAELASMGVRRQPVLPFLSRSHWCNRKLGVLRQHLRRALTLIRPTSRN